MPREKNRGVMIMNLLIKAGIKLKKAVEEEDVGKIREVMNKLMEWQNKNGYDSSVDWSIKYLDACLLDIQKEQERERKNANQ